MAVSTTQLSAKRGIGSDWLAMARVKTRTGGPGLMDWTGKKEFQICILKRSFPVMVAAIILAETLG
jgi:hypothetical protein